MSRLVKDAGLYRFRENYKTRNLFHITKTSGSGRVFTQLLVTVTPASSVEGDIWLVFGDASAAEKQNKANIWNKVKHLQDEGFGRGSESLHV